MSYCVNCGVELDTSAKKCALCNTPVYHPGVEHHEHERPPYPDSLAIPRGVRKKYTAFLLSVIMLIPNIVCLITNLLMPHTGNWSVYVISSSFLVWIFAVLPLLFKKVNPYIILLADTFAALAYEYVFYSEFTANGWFFRLAAPFTLLLSVFCLFFIIWLRRKQRNKLQCIIIVLNDVALFSLVADVLFNLFYENDHILFVSVIIFMSCFCLEVFAYVVEKNERFKAWLSRRFYY